MPKYILFAEVPTGNVVSQMWLHFAYDFCAKKVSHVQRSNTATRRETRILATGNIPTL